MRFEQWGDRTACRRREMAPRKRRVGFGLLALVGLCSACATPSAPLAAQEPVPAPMALVAERDEPAEPRSPAVGDLHPSAAAPAFQHNRPAAEDVHVPDLPQPRQMAWCMRSRMCELEGFCSAGRGGQCIAASDSDCADSGACKGGRCSAHEGRCIAASDEDCRDSWACKGWGRCYHDGDEACMATDASDCTNSTRCARLGECKLVGGVCSK